MVSAEKVDSYSKYVDYDNGLIDRKIMSDPEIYKQEMERIFARAWLFLCHESQIPNAGDFFQTYMGEDRVIVSRARDMSINVLLNTCPHRGNMVCRQDSGNTSSFMCAYHGWTFDSSGSLIGLPGSKGLFHGTLDREKWGLRRAAQVESYNGFIFATLDPKAPTFHDYLGPAGRFSMDAFTDYGELEVIPGVIKHRVPCNWKMAMENTTDYYHVSVAHVAALNLMGVFELLEEDMERPGVVILGDYGHVADATTHDGPVRHVNIFPNALGFVETYQSFIVRHPRGPMETEMWYFSLVDKNATPEHRESIRLRAARNLGPAGLIEQEDAENWELSSKASQSTAMRRSALNYQMGLGHGTVRDDGVTPYARIDDEPIANDHYMRWGYRSWAEWMDADDWPMLEQIRTNPGEA
ncbi:Large subunit naph/bph dioxygenase [Rhodococcus wratislaviensis]|uniref:Large subunit naph/bph dioxygenase n=1 Tax=Rhodococcus wratislaviensis TaxID=44752 RepID=A0A402CKX9_RHOWR|nr:SRPBCC family protein [Rhodococcus wratislaviensis]GCE44254.1 Large subunit naph/bph dioxygenase [Rhodococcus wratislaviensis]